MRAVALADKSVQEKIAASFVPLKVTIMPGTKELPLEWEAMKHWRVTYGRMGGEKCEGFTCCSVVSPDLEAEYGNTGSAFVWEMFDSIAYDADKFAGMLGRSIGYFEQEQAIQSDADLDDSQKSEKIAALRRTMRREIGRAGRFHFPPSGFSIEGAKDLFRLTGDLED